MEATVQVMAGTTVVATEVRQTFCLSVFECSYRIHFQGGLGGLSGLGGIGSYGGEFTKQ
jgi:hypothetical protein